MQKYGPDEPSYPPGTIVEARSRMPPIMQSDIKQAIVISTTVRLGVYVVHGCKLLTSDGRIVEYGAKYLIEVEKLRGRKHDNTHDAPRHARAFS